MKYISIILIGIIMILSSCMEQKQNVDLIITNANVYTVNGNFEIVQSFAINEGKFVEIGASDAILSKYTSNKTIDLQGKAVYPGFYDAHCHFYGYGLDLSRADLNGTKSFDEVINRVKEHATKFPAEWIKGRGWDQNDWDLKEFPTNEMLDIAFPNTPVILTRVDGHAVIANTEALKRAGLDITSKIEGGKLIQKDGRLTGVLIDNAIDLLTKSIPKPNKNEITKVLLQAQKACFKVGLTTVDDAGLSKEIVLLIDELQQADSIKMRIYAMLDPSDENMEYFVKKGIYKTEKLNVRSIKLYADGALGSRGACLIHEYSDDPGNLGFLLNAPKRLMDISKQAFKYNYQINTHAIGDSANRIMLNIYSEILKSKNDKRWRIEHAQVIDPDDFSLFSQYSIVPSVQPTHATSDMYWADKRLGNKRVKNAYAYKTLLEQNGWIAAGSDFPVENINPLYGFFAAVARQDFNGYPNDGYQMENALSREQALKAMTIWAAKSNFEENERGSIEAGKMADFVILENDIMTIEIQKVPKVKVEQTFIGGEKVF